MTNIDSLIELAEANAKSAADQNLPNESVIHLTYAIRLKELKQKETSLFDMLDDFIAFRAKYYKDGNPDRNLPVNSDHECISDFLQEKGVKQSQATNIKNNVMEIKPVKDRDNNDLLELTLQLHNRALAYPSKEMHDAYIQARTELETRFKQSQSGAEQEGWISVDIKVLTAIKECLEKSSILEERDNTAIVIYNTISDLLKSTLPKATDK